MINYNTSLKINTKASWHDKALKSCSTSLPGGDQVDDLPPAASKYGVLDPADPGSFGTFRKFWEVF